MEIQGVVVHDDVVDNGAIAGEEKRMLRVVVHVNGVKPATDADPALVIEEDREVMANGTRLRDICVPFEV